MSTTNNDIELLELAAKAAGIRWDHEECGTLYLLDPLRPWEPINDDGDEARLEAKLRLRVIWYGNCVSVGHDGSGAIEFFQDHGGDEQAARRYAGVRAAAAIGSAMP
jgi:hypothetical protein